MIRPREMALDNSILQVKDADVFTDVIPCELIVAIFSELHFYELLEIATVCKKVNLLTNDPGLLKRVIYRDMTFNPEDWKHHFGDQSPGANDAFQAFEALPENIGEILKKTCSIFPNKRIFETCMVVWLPNLSANQFDQVVKQRLHPISNFVLSIDFPRAGKSQVTKKAEWVIISNKTIPKSAGSDNPIGLLESYKMEGFNPPELPTFLEAIVGTTTTLFKYNILNIKSVLCRQELSDKFGSPVVWSYTHKECMVASSIHVRSSVAPVWRFKC